MTTHAAKWATWEGRQLYSRATGLCCIPRTRSRPIFSRSPSVTFKGCIIGPSQCYWISIDSSCANTGTRGPRNLRLSLISWNDCSLTLSTVGMDHPRPTHDIRPRSLIYGCGRVEIHGPKSTNCPCMGGPEGESAPPQIGFQDRMANDVDPSRSSAKGQGIECQASCKNPGGGVMPGLWHFEHSNHSNGSRSTTPRATVNQ
jgi:hypothetical protein